MSRSAIAGAPARMLELIPLVPISVMRGTGTPPTKSAGTPVVPRIHVFRAAAKTWMAGPSPAMTNSTSLEHA